MLHNQKTRRGGGDCLPSVRYKPDYLDGGGISMLRALAALALGAVALAGSVAGAQAQSIYADEIRGGLYWHSADSGDFDASRLEDVNVELLFAIPTLDEALAIGRLRPHVGATINFGGLESMVYGGISWTVPIGDTPFFVEAAFGGTIHNGHLEGADKPYRNLGCSVMFHESISLGYEITEQASIMATAEHASHASLCDGPNQGLTNVGIRLGWKF